MTTTPRQSRLAVNGVELALYEWPGAGRPILFAHATGFHARCWDRVIARLPGRRVYAVDLRGHGASAKPPPPAPYAWRRFGEDLAALGRALDLRGALAVGHSIGGHAAALAAALEPDLFAALLLIEPVILPPEEYAPASDPPSAAHFAARRRDRWASPGEMFARFKDRPPFDRWDPAVLRDYCEHGLTPAPDGDGFVLACPPAVEAAIYGGSGGSDIYPEIARVEVPVRVVRAGGPRAPGAFDTASSFAAPDLAARFRRGEDVYLPQYSHLLPMEAPALVADQVRQLAG